MTTKPRSAPVFWRGLPLLLSIGALGCGATQTLDLQLVLPEGADPLASVDELVLTITQVNKSKRVKLPAAQPFSVELELDVNSEVASIVLEGRGGGALLARGETPRILLRPVDDTFKLLVSPVGALAGLKPRASGLGYRSAATVLPGIGVLAAGGQDVGGQALAGAVLYDIYEHALSTMPNLPAPRAGALAVPCGSTCALLVLGRGSDGLPAETMLRYDAGTWSSLPDGLVAAERRSEAALVPLGDGVYLLAGGVDAAGKSLSSLLRLVPSSNGSPRISLFPAPARAARRAPATASTGTIALFAGGQEAGAAAAELFFLASESSQVLTLAGPQPSRGCAAVALGDGRFALIGGEDEQGTLLRDGWLVDPIAQKVAHVPEALSKGRAGHSLLLVGEHVLVVGGRDAQGLAAEAEVLARDSLGSLRAFAQQAPREGQQLVSIAPGTALVVGGLDMSGSVTMLEAYQTFAPQPSP